VTSVKKYDFAGKEKGEIEISDELLQFSTNSQMIKDYLVAMRENLRQWNANTKGRKEVSKSGKKPHPQKGTGRARQGCLAATQYKGGGIVFGPRTKVDQHVRINRKEKRAAIRHLLVEKVKGNNLYVLENPILKEPKTQDIAKFLKQIKVDGKRVLFLSNVESGNLVKSLRNIPRVEFVFLPNVNGYDLALSQEIVVLDGAVDEFMAILGKVGNNG
jgi:large subunit ribosomal protein L4